MKPLRSIVFGILLLALAGKPANSQAPVARPAELLPQFAMPYRAGAIAFSPSGELLAVLNRSGVVNIWDVRGRLVKNIRDYQMSREFKTFIKFSNDGKRLFSANLAVVSVWDLESGERIAQLVPQDAPNDSFNGIALSEDGKTLITSGMDGTIGFWDLEKFRLVKLLRPQAKPSAVPARGQSKAFIPVTRPPDVTAQSGIPLRPESKALITEDRGLPVSVGIYDPQGKLARTVKMADIFKFETKRTLYSVIPDYCIAAATTNADLIAVSCPGKKIRILETRNPAMYTEVPRNNADLSLAADFLSAGRFAALNRENLKVFDLSGGISATVAESTAGNKPAMSVSPDKKFIAISQSGSGTYYDPQEGRPLEGALQLWNTEGKLLRKFENAVCFAQSAFSPDSSKLAFVGRNSTVEVYDLGSGSFFPPIPLGLQRVIPQVTALLFSPDSKSLIVREPYDTTIKVWDIRTGKLTRELPGQLKHFAENPIGLSQDGKVVYDKLWIPRLPGMLYPPGEEKFKRDVTLVDFYTAQTTGFYTEVGEYPDEDSVFRFSPDGKTLAIGTYDGNILMIDLATKQETYYKPNRSDFTYPKVMPWEYRTPKIKGLTFSDDGKYLLTTAEDSNAVTLWNVNSKQSVSYISAGNDWLMYTPDGYFDASPHGGNLVAMVKGLEAYNIDQFAARNNRPDLILERMGLGSMEQISHYNSLYQKRLKKLGLTEASLSAEPHTPEARITAIKRDGKFANVSFTVSDSKYQLKRYNFHINGVPLFGPYGRPITSRSFSGAEKVELTAGKNLIELTAMNEAGAESYRAAAHADNDGKEKGALYYLAFGASKYKDASLNLNYADKDAKDLEALVAKMGASYSAVHTKIYLNSEATGDNLKKGREFFKDAKVDDTVILFIAGHGGYDKTGDPKYYYLPYEADPANLTGTGLDFATIENLLNYIKPRKKLLIMDTCESGELDEDAYAQYYAAADARGITPRTSRKPRKTRGNPNNKSRAYLLNKNRFIHNDLSRRSGTVVFSSSRGGEVSYESSSIRNGFFTEGLIAGLTSRTADKNRNGKVDMVELLDFVAGAVAGATGGLQHPTIDRDNLYQEIELPLIPN